MPESSTQGASYLNERKNSSRRPEFEESDVSQLDSYEQESNSSHTVKDTLRGISGSNGPVLDHRVTRLETDVKHLKRHVEGIIDSLPSRSADEHSEHHDVYAEQLKVSREKAAEDKKLKKDLKEKFIKTIVQGIFMAVVAIMLLGIKSQFSDWVNKAVDEKAAEKLHNSSETTVHAPKEPK